MQYEHERFHIYNADNMIALAALPDNSVDSIVTDPPYGIEFMNKGWDNQVPGVDLWKECLRVLKPGGHLLAFAGTRTQHRMATAIEDAGFEIRDMIAWVYGSGFPKALDVSKAIDKAAGADRGSSYVPHGDNGIFSEGKGKAAGVDRTPGVKLSDPAVTPAAKQWDGWGTALKPALEPITVARKPFKVTVAANVLEHGTGALNIDGCRVGTDGGTAKASKPTGDGNGIYGSGLHGSCEIAQLDKGRWPANLIHDGSDEVVALFPVTKSGAMKSGTNRSAQDVPGSVCYGVFGGNTTSKDILASEGSAARFFYCPKATKKDRDEGLEAFIEKATAASNQAQAELARGNLEFENGGKHNAVKMRKNIHPTVKPTDLMAYLCRLVTPPGGTVLDPFMGSGSTGKAALREGFRFVGMELSDEYFEIAKARIEKEA